MTHYAQPAVSGINSDIESVSSDFKRYQRKRLQEQTNEDSAIASGSAVPQWTKIEKKSNFERDYFLLDGIVMPGMEKIEQEILFPEEK